MKLLLTSLTGFLIPGLGHLLQGRKTKAAVFFGLLGGLFLVGISLDPDYYQKFGASILGPPNFDPAQLPPVPPQPGGPEGLVDWASRVIFTYVFPFCVGFFMFVLGHVIQPLVWGLYQGMGLVGIPGEAPVAIKDVGYCFAQLAGLLNILAMMDAYDIGYNRALYEKRWARD